jgi:hypothetical protein
VCPTPTDRLWAKGGWNKCVVETTNSNQHVLYDIHRLCCFKNIILL